MTTPQERVLAGRLGAHLSWANTEDRAARTAAARAAFDQRFLDEADPDGVLSEAERERRAEHLRKAYYARLSLKAAQARRRKREGALSPDNSDSDGGTP